MLFEMSFDQGSPNVRVAFWPGTMDKGFCLKLAFFMNACQRCIFVLYIPVGSCWYTTVVLVTV